MSHQSKSQTPELHVDQRMMYARQNLALLSTIALAMASAAAHGADPCTSLSFESEALHGLHRLCLETYGHVRAIDAALSTIDNFSVPAPDVDGGEWRVM